MTTTFTTPRNAPEAAAALTMNEVLVTPEIAQQWLSKNTRNRNVSKNAVAALARDMKEGRYRLDTGEAIKFFRDGTLADGQHRLHAVVASGVAVRFLVVSNLPEETAGFIDKGRKRTVGDDLAIAGYKNANTLASFVPHMATIAAKNTVQLSATEVREVIDAHPGLHEVSQSGAMKGLGSLRSIAGAITYIGIYLGRRTEAETFFEVLATGVPSAVFCPVHQFRERFIREKSRGTSLDRNLALKLACKSFNMLCAGDYKSLVAPQHPEIPGWNKADLFQRRADGDQA